MMNATDSARLALRLEFGGELLDWQYDAKLIEKLSDAILDQRRHRDELLATNNRLLTEKRNLESEASQSRVETALLRNELIRLRAAHATLAGFITWLGPDLNQDVVDAIAAGEPPITLRAARSVSVLPIDAGSGGLTISAVGGITIDGGGNIVIAAGDPPVTTE